MTKGAGLPARDLNFFRITPETTTAETAPTTTLPVPEIEQSTHSEKFRDENGRVVYTVDVVVPHLWRNVALGIYYLVVALKHTHTQRNRGN